MFGPGLDGDCMESVHGQRLDKDWTKTGLSLYFVSMSSQQSVTSTKVLIADFVEL